MLRWHLQLGNIAIPKTGNLERLQENFAVFEFTLADNEIEAISELDRGKGAVMIDSDKLGH